MDLRKTHIHTIEKAIEEFRKECLGVYRASPDRIIRDTRAAERAAKDHVGRWLFELLQNSDDATASEVRILVEGDAVYVADKGLGLKPEAVSAICGTDFSDKTIGTIGRKGVGFKSVYEVSSNPQVLTVNGEGIEFNHDRAEAWLRENGFDGEHVPYQWIPFFISWDEARRQDPILDSLADYRTVVRLRGVSPDTMLKVVQLLKEWPPHALFTFRHVRRITGPHLEVDIAPSEEAWELNDIRGESPKSWLVARYTEHDVPPELLVPLGTDERKAIKDNGVSFLVAAPLADGCTLPTSEYLPVHVFYPTEQKGPVQLLLHAEFLVKSDRTAIIPIEDSHLNTWVAERLACHICQFVNDAYQLETPSSHVALLMPLEDKASHPVAEVLWQHIAEVAKTHLRLGDAEGEQHLAVDEARLVSVTVRPDLTHKILEGTDIRRQLLHHSFDEDEDARKALEELGCEKIQDQGVMDAIAGNAELRATDTHWIWACWKWLAAWVGKEPYGDEHRERVKRVKGLPVVPVDGRLLSLSDLAGRIVTWRVDSQTEEFPDWLPLTFVEDWFRDSIQALKEQEDAVKKLRKELGIKEPGEDVIQRAVGLAIEQYWKDKRGDPLRFLLFMYEQDWHETSISSTELQRCPVPLSRPVQNKGWAEARKAYFGSDRGNDLLADLYNGIETIAWVGNDGTKDTEEKCRRVLEWLGVADCPRIVKVAGETDVYRLPDDCCDWKRYLETEKNRRGAAEIKINGISGIDHLVITKLKHKHAVLFVNLLATHWDSYYSNHHKFYADLYGPRGGYHGRGEVKAKWWWEVSKKLALPVCGGSGEYAPLTKCWLPDKRAERAIGDLLPVIDLDLFGDDKDIVRYWLVSAVGLRTQIEQVTIEEWKELLSTIIPALAPAERVASNERLRDKVTKWYAACLETVADLDNVPDKAFATCPLLCRKGDSWQYVNDEPRYLDDDNEIAKAFNGDVWLFHVPSRLMTDAVKYFDVLLLSKSVRTHVEPGEPRSPLVNELQTKFSDSLPYIWVWRSSRSKQDTDRLSSYLKRLKVHVVPTLKAHLDLNGVGHEVERRFDVTDDVILLHAGHDNEDTLAQALAKGVDMRSEADFYENLLRCNDSSQRKEKLLSKGIPDAEVERCLREYAGQQEIEEPDIGRPAKERREKSSPSTTPTDSARPQQTGSGHGTQQLKTSVQPLEPTISQESFRLKDPQKTHYIVSIQPVTESAYMGGGGSGGASDREAHQLTKKQKDELEKAGRDIAMRELEKMGYTVEQMPTDNPGFDLRGSKGDEELRVEVKAHVGRATVADVTHRQYKEYLGQQGYKWELWNVEILGEQDMQPVTVTRYDVIPDEALDARTFRVDLKKCRSPDNQR